MTKQQKMFAMVQKWERSGLAKSEFARQHDLPLQTFHYWFRRYQQQHTERLTPTFIELPSPAIAPSRQSDPSQGSPRLSLEFPDGLRISIY